MLGASDDTRLETTRQRWDAARAGSYRMTVRLHGAWFGGVAEIEVSRCETW